MKSVEQCSKNLLADEGFSFSGEILEKSQKEKQKIISGEKNEGNWESHKENYGLILQFISGKIPKSISGGFSQGISGDFFEISGGILTTILGVMNAENNGDLFSALH